MKRFSKEHFKNRIPALVGAGFVSILLAFSAYYREPITGALFTVALIGLIYGFFQDTTK